MSPFETILNDYSSGWRAWQSPLRTMERHAHGQNIYRVSANILRVHEAPAFPGGFIASLSIPWGFSKGDDDMGGYHLVWPRDLCETGGALLACGAYSEVRRILVIFGRPRRETDRGGRTIGWTARPIGAACSSMNARSPCCSWIWPDARARSGPRTSHNSGRWSSARRVRPAHRAQNQARPLGGERRLYALHACCRHCVAARRGGDRRSCLPRRGASGFAARLADAWNEQIEELGSMSRIFRSRASGRPRLLHTGCSRDCLPWVARTFMDWSRCATTRWKRSDPRGPTHQHRRDRACPVRVEGA